MGEKIRQARLEAGLSQRQLCGGHITRNMLSQIENGSARPSMDTLRLLAQGLGKPVSYFLEETAVTSPNLAVMEQSRNAFREGRPEAALEALKAYREPDPVFDPERGLLRALCHMSLAEKALAEDRSPYASRLLELAEEDARTTPYFTPELERRRVLLLSQAVPGREGELVSMLPADDRELLLRARAALDRGDSHRAGALLDAAENRQSPQWHFLRGEAWFAQGDYEAAAAQFLLAEEVEPARTAPRLEACYRELGDYKRAYEYACKQR